MQTIKIIIFLSLFLTISAHAQKHKQAKSQGQTIEVNNDNGHLFIHLENSEVQEFVINDKPVDKSKYNDYQSIIEEFTNEVKVSPPSPPSIREMAAAPVDESAEVSSRLVNFLTEEQIITSKKKYKVHLKSDYVKVNGKKFFGPVHKECLDIFNEVYSENLNRKSEVKLRKSRGGSSTSVSLIQLEKF